MRESPWEKRDAFLELNPAGQTPVMVAPSRGIALVGSCAITEFFEETVEATPLMPDMPVARAEVRRVVAWLDERFFDEVVGPLSEERMIKRIVHRAAPDTAMLRHAMKTANGHLDYLDYLLDHRRWLGGDAMSLADLAAAAHVSVADYLGGIDWRGHTQTLNWYRGMKSRPSFRPLLTERMEVVQPPPHYDKVDF